MDKEVRNAIERATQKARRLLEEEFEKQLVGDFDVLLDGKVAPRGGDHLSPRQHAVRERIVASVAHRRAAGEKPAEAVASYARDAAFTTLNRFVALRMLEARGLLKECVSRGEQSSGYGEFHGLAPGLKGLPDGTGYRLYLESLFDELSTEVKVLFDRRDPASALWPRKGAFDDLLAVLNAPELSAVWGEDETIGWVYQYFNSGEERRAMRDASQAPRNSRELAVRNQFFTPRYVVRFLTENTLARIWIEMMGGPDGASRIADRCEFLVRDAESRGPRAKKDPRDLKLLDPACGSGHFLLYAFDLLIVIYEEAWADPEAAPFTATGRTLRQDYPDLESLRKAAPQLVLEHNLHGVDIDPRCAQIAALALWLRAQRAWKDAGVPAGARPRITRTHIVVAEPMPGDEALVEEFAATLNPPLLGGLFRKMVAEMRLAGELGTLLKIETLLGDEIRKANAEFNRQKRKTGYLPGFEPPPTQGQLDFSQIDEDTFFDRAEEMLLAALRRYAESAEGGAGARRRLFAGDAAQGIALLDVLWNSYDSVLMNPPFGLMPKRCYSVLVESYPDAYYDLAVSFMMRGLELTCSGGACGSITSRSYLLVTDAERFRRHVALHRIDLLADLGADVMDGAAVDASAQIMSPAAHGPLRIIDLRTPGDKEPALLSAIGTGTYLSHDRDAFRQMPGTRLAYDSVQDLAPVFCILGGIEPTAGVARIGASTFDDVRFLRARWEVGPERLGSIWKTSSRTADEFSLYYFPPLLTMKWHREGREVCAKNELVNGQMAQAKQGSSIYGLPGVVFSRRSSPSVAFRIHPAGASFASNTGVVIPNEDVPAYLLLGVVNSACVRAAINTLSNRDSYTVGHVKQIAWPSLEEKQAKRIEALSRSLTEERHRLFRIEETDPWFDGTGFLSEHDVWAAFSRWAAESSRLGVRWLEVQSEIDNLVADAYGITDLKHVRDAFGISLHDVVEPRRLLSIERSEWLRRCLSLAFGVALGRWSVELMEGRRDELQKASPDPMSELTPLPVVASRTAVGMGLLVDDPGHSQDVQGALAIAWSRLWPAYPDAYTPEMHAALGLDVRLWLRQRLFEFHCRVYTAGKRTAPIYWQLATPSASYSVWLYCHRLTPDSFFHVLHEFVAPKLALEERKLLALTQEAGPNPTSSHRKEIAAQEAFVDELRAFRDEMARVAPLWKPDLDDGVLLTMAPLWRLVPQHRAWQKELKTAWDSLCEGEYDWAHVAMHLWPERVVPKCAKDRSLAIAHDLEEVFWEEDAKGKWVARPEPLRPIEELVRERTSPAVKAALKDLLEAPVAGGPAKGAGRGWKRKA